MSKFNQYNDQDLLDLFSDWYKEVNGFRPRGEYWTRERMISWMDYESSPAVQEQRQAEWAAEAARLDELDRKFLEGVL